MHLTGLKKQQKPNPNLGVQGGIVDVVAPIDVSNVAIYNPETKKADRVGFRVEDGKKVRFFKSNNQIISFEGLKNIFRLNILPHFYLQATPKMPKVLIRDTANVGFNGRFNRFVKKQEF